jgi:hypothetical protein
MSGEERVVAAINAMRRELQHQGESRNSSRHGARGFSTGNLCLRE